MSDRYLYYQQYNVLTNKQQRSNQDGQQFDTHNHRYI